MKKANLIRTPKERITLGECIRTDTGEPTLEVKKSNKDKYETIPMRKLTELMILTSNRN
ncbi:MAG: hypothetical protein MRZ25_03000 [Ruminococcus sp.]|nr:hypothetical protein [Ruminococcus sp.]